MSEFFNMAADAFARVGRLEFALDAERAKVKALREALGMALWHYDRNVCRHEDALEIDEDILPLEVVHQLLAEGGNKIGVGDFRPEKGGPFGRFAVTKWECGQ